MRDRFSTHQKEITRMEKDAGRNAGEMDWNWARISADLCICVCINSYADIYEIYVKHMYLNTQDHVYIYIHLHMPLASSLLHFICLLTFITYT